MKALKEKRISLRSLWRRGLVILSLFALVFASCNNTDEPEGSTSSGPKKIPAQIRILSQPANPSYEGLAIDLSGLKAEVQYEGSTDWYPVTDLNRIKVTPNIGVCLDTRIYPRWDNGARVIPVEKYDTGTTIYTTEFGSFPDYKFLYVEDGGQLEIPTNTIDIKGGIDAPKIVPLARVDGTWFDSAVGINSKYYKVYSAQGVQLTGSTKMKTKSIFVDGRPDFSDLTCEAHYMDGREVPVPLQADTIKWQILPRYDSGDKEITGTGYLEVTIGYYLPPNRTMPASFGVSDYAVYEEVFHVVSIDVTLPPEEEMPKFFYWEDDGVAAWVDRFAGTNTTIKVNYSSGADPSYREIKIQDAINENKVYWNDNPEGPGNPDNGSPWDESYPSVIYDGRDINYLVPFAIMGIQDTVDAIGDKKAASLWPNFTTP